MTHGIHLIRNVFASYLNEYGKGYDRTTFLQYVACCIFSEAEKTVAVEALKQAARNLNWQAARIKEPSHGA